MKRITHILLFLLLLFSSSFETIDMVASQGPLRANDNKHQSNKGDHQDVAIDDLIIVKYRNLNLDAAAAKQKAAFYGAFFDAVPPANRASLYGLVSDQPRQLAGFGNLHLYYIY